MTNNAVTNQAQSTVSLADAPAHLREIAQALQTDESFRSVTAFCCSEEGRDDEAAAHRLAEERLSKAREDLLAIASSLEQTQAPAEIGPEGIDRESLMAHARYVPLQIETPAANICSDQVTITLSREDAAYLAGPRVEYDRKREARIEAATRTALQSPTPERRE